MRNYLITEYTDTYTTLFSGIVIWLICPVLFQVQYVLLGVALSTEPFKKFAKTISNSVKSMAEQIVLIYDLSLFPENPLDGMGLSVLNVSRLILGYIIYMLPIGLLLTAFSFFSFNVPLCRQLHAPWLLDNTAIPAPFVLESGELRTISFSEFKTAKDWSEEDYPKFTNFPTINQAIKDQPRSVSLNDIPDLLMQFNHAGFHDICIYPSKYQVYDYKEICWFSEKRLTFCYPGYSVTNSTGEDF